MDKANGFNINSLMYCGCVSNPAMTCSKLTIEILEQGVKYVQG